MVECKKCGAKVTKKQLEYIERTKQFPNDCDHIDECGCMEDTEDGVQCFCDW